MFADEIIAAQGTFEDNFTGGAITRMAALLPKAQRFRITEHVLDAVLAVCDLPLKQRIRAMSFAQLPFATTWIEWRDDGERWGVLVETDASAQCGTLRVVCQHPDDDAPIAATGFCTFDWREHYERVPGSVPAIDEPKFREVMDETEGVVPATLDELNEVNARHATTFEPCPARERDPDVCDRADDECLSFAARMAFALLLLIHNKHETVQEPYVPSTQLQKARLKRGKPALLDFVEVGVSLSRLAELRAARAASGGEHSPMRLHMVRRHPRVLPKGGVVFVKPHQRGSAVAGVITQQTRVVRR